MPLTCYQQQATTGYLRDRRGGLLETKGDSRRANNWRALSRARVNYLPFQKWDHQLLLDFGFRLEMQAHMEYSNLPVILADHPYGNTRLGSKGVRVYG